MRSLGLLGQAQGTAPGSEEGQKVSGSLGSCRARQEWERARGPWLPTFAIPRCPRPAPCCPHWCPWGQGQCIVGMVSWGQGEECAGVSKGETHRLPLPPTSHPGLCLILTSAGPSAPPSPPPTHGVQSLEEEVYQHGAACILQHHGQLSLRTQGETCYHPSCHPTFTRTPGPHCSGPCWGAWHFSKSPKGGEGWFQGRSWRSLGACVRETREEGTAEVGRGEGLGSLCP